MLCCILRQVPQFTQSVVQALAGSLSASPGPFFQCLSLAVVCSIGNSAPAAAASPPSIHTSDTHVLFSCACPRALPRRTYSTTQPLAAPRLFQFSAMSTNPPYTEVPVECEPSRSAPPASKAASNDGRPRSGSRGSSSSLGPSSSPCRPL
jgi:hypothetical protein